MNTYVWELDSAGKPKGYKYGFGSESEVAKSRREYSVDCDDEGNITEVRDSLGKTILTSEYTKILRPSQFAWAKAQIVDFENYNDV